MDIVILFVETARRSDAHIGFFNLGPCAIDGEGKIIASIGEHPKTFDPAHVLYKNRRTSKGQDCFSNNFDRIGENRAV